MRSVHTPPVGEHSHCSQSHQCQVPAAHSFWATTSTQTRLHTQTGWHVPWCCWKYCKRQQLHTSRDMPSLFIPKSNRWAAVYLWLRARLLLGAFKGVYFLFTHLVCVSNDIVSRGIGRRQALHQPQDLCGVTTCRRHHRHMRSECDNNTDTKHLDKYHYKTNAGGRSRMTISVKFFNNFKTIKLLSWFKLVTAPWNTLC